MGKTGSEAELHAANHGVVVAPTGRSPGGARRTRSRMKPSILLAQPISNWACQGRLFGAAVVFGASVPALPIGVAGGSSCGTRRRTEPPHGGRMIPPGPRGRKEK